MVDIAIIALILIFQPLIALVWLYIFIRLVTNFAVGRAEKAIDGRMEKAVAELKGR